MASVNTLIRSGRCVVVKGNAVELTAAMPLTGKVTVVLPVPPEKAEEYARELRKALEWDGGRRYHAIFSIWIAIAKRAFALK